MKRIAIVTAALAAAVAVLILVTIPPARLALQPTPDGTVTGVLHVHTNRSDGRSAPEDVAAAAARAGLKFVVFTDHGDATRRPDPPVYHSGVLCLDGVEISTTGGHYIALDMPASPYPLAGEARDVVEDVRRLGGFGIVAHPNSPKQELRWREWTAPFDGIELTNPDTSWRLHAQKPGWRPRARLVALLLDHPFRPAETLASLLEQPTETLTRWDVLTARRRVVSVAGADAHANLELRNTGPGENRLSIPLPSYVASFRMLSVHVRPDQELRGDATADAAVIMRALRAGHVYSAIDGLASPPSFELTATNQRGTVHEGDELALGGPVTLRVRSNAPPEFTSVVWQGSRVLSGGHHEQDFTVQAGDAPGVYRVEILAPGGNPPLAWIFSNPIYVRGADPLTQVPVRPAPARSEPLFDGKSANGWHLEHDQVSLGALEVGPTVGGSELRLRYALASDPESRPYVALYHDTPNGVAAYDRVAFTVRAEHPMRISVQLRLKGPGQRWQRSVYVDADDRERTVYVDDLTPVGETSTWRPPLADISNVMFVVENTNTKPGSSGRVWIKSAALQK